MYFIPNFYLNFFLRVTKVSQSRVRLKLRLTAKIMAMVRLTYPTGQQPLVNMPSTSCATNPTSPSLHTWPKSARWLPTLTRLRLRPTVPDFSGLGWLWTSGRSLRLTRDGLAGPRCMWPPWMPITTQSMLSSTTTKMGLTSVDTCQRGMSNTPSSYRMVAWAYPTVRSEWVVLFQMLYSDHCWWNCLRRLFMRWFVTGTEISHSDRGQLFLVVDRIVLNSLSTLLYRDCVSLTYLVEEILRTLLFHPHLNINTKFIWVV